MRGLKLYMAFMVFSFINFGLFAQKTEFKGYRIENDTVIFQFDVREYSKFTKDRSGQRLEFDDFDIENVVVSGEFNSWSRNNWRMHKVNDYVYELKKNISHFNDAFSWEFKYVINNAYWAEPPKRTPNIAKATENGKKIWGIYNLKMYTAYPSENGNATFKLKGHKDAKKVVLAGSFNKWNAHHFKMRKTNRGWELTLKMKPDMYQYRFIVDGHWMEDPHNPHRVKNEFGEYNSVLNIKQYVTFKLRGYKNAKKVILAGSFNSWNEHDFVMQKTDDGWQYTVPLSGGKHHYKFIVDGKWIVDPNNSVREYDAHGHINSVYMVK